MEERLIVFIFAIILQHSSGESFRLCDNTRFMPPNLKCSHSIWGTHNSDDVASCAVEYVPPDSSDCKDGFSSRPVLSNSRLGQISIKPFVLYLQCSTYSMNHTVPNIVFSNIKWKKLKFRVEQLGVHPAKRHCRSLEITDTSTIDDRSVLQYDCYKSLLDGGYDGPTHVLDLEATDGTVVDTRQFVFYIPSLHMISPNPSEAFWKPFVYVENLTTSMQLHIVPPPAKFNFTYNIEVKKTCTGCPNDVMVENHTMVKHNDGGDEVIYDYTPTAAGVYYFHVTTLHDQCVSGKVECQVANSPILALDAKTNMLYFSFTVIVSIIMVSLLLYFIYRRHCRGPSEIPKPTKVVVIYPSANSVHADCVASFVDYLRSEYGFDISYDGDIPRTSHCDPYFWAEDVIREASHILYIVGPKENEDYPNRVHQNVDKLLLSFLKAIRAIHPKEVINVFFEYSNGPVPNETRNDKVFYLLRDWQKLINYLSRDLLPTKQIMRTDRGKCLLENLTQVKKSLNESSDAKSINITL